MTGLRPPAHGQSPQADWGDVVACLGKVYHLTAGDVEALSYGQVQAYLNRLPTMQERDEAAVTGGMVPIVNAVFAK